MKTKSDAILFVEWCEERDLDPFEVYDESQENEDFTIDDRYRFIHREEIDDIQRQELQNDLYILGCFNANFLAGILPISLEAILKMQEAEAFEALGEICTLHIDEIQEGYSDADGYGHHFAHYDHEEHELVIGFLNYLAFRIN